jgi:hypothetical protein
VRLDLPDSQREKQNQAKAVPSPGGEGQVEGERQNKLSSVARPSQNDFGSGSYLRPVRATVTLSGGG